MIIKNLIFLIILMMTQNQILYQFSPESSLQNWYIVDDVVMGGRSSGKFYINKQGHGVFAGHVSLENNGGFSSLRYQIDQNVSLAPYSNIVLKVKGDTKTYQLRIKDKRTNYYSYTASFNTSDSWQVIKIPLKQMYPTYRGRKLNLGNFNKDQIEELSFLISNKKAEDFKLEIDFISLE